MKNKCCTASAHLHVPLRIQVQLGPHALNEIQYGKYMCVCALLFCMNGYISQCGTKKAASSSCTKLEGHLVTLVTYDLDRAAYM